jgi:Mn-dependent DtxR family transcriptional regulator
MPSGGGIIGNGIVAEKLKAKPTVVSVALSGLKKKGYIEASGEGSFRRLHRSCTLIRDRTYRQMIPSVR